MTSFYGDVHSGGAPKGNRNASKLDSDKVSGKGRILLDLEHWKFTVDNESELQGISKKRFVMDAISFYYSHLEEQRIAVDKKAK